jgi:hypothetical protein
VPHALKLAAEDTPLAARFFDTDFHEANFSAGKFLPDLPADLPRHMLGQQLRAGVGEGQEQDILLR